MTNEEFRLQAIRELVPNGSTHTYNSSGKKRETYTLVFDPSKESDPTKEQIQAKVAELIAAYPLQELRSERNALLAATDWRDLPSYAGTKQAEWRVYRRSLRDITVGLDTVEKVNAATFPTQPS